MAFKFRKLDIPDVVLIEAQAFKDQRGLFMESYKRSDFSANGIARYLCAGQLFSFASREFSEACTIRNILRPG